LLQAAASGDAHKGAVTYLKQRQISCGCHEVGQRPEARLKDEAPACCHRHVGERRERRYCCARISRGHRPKGTARRRCSGRAAQPKRDRLAGSAAARGLQRARRRRSAAVAQPRSHLCGITPAQLAKAVGSKVRAQSRLEKQVVR